MSKLEQEHSRNGRPAGGPASRGDRGADGNQWRQSPGGNPLYRAALRHFDRGDWETGTLLLDNLAQYGKPGAAAEASDGENGRPAREQTATVVADKANGNLPGRSVEASPARNGNVIERIPASLVEKVSQEFGVQHSHLFRQHPLYRSMQRHIADEEWERALIVADSLVLSFPYEEGLAAIRKDILQRAGAGPSGRRRKAWLAALALLCLLIIAVGGLFLRYLRDPAPLAELVALGSDLNYEPHYLFSIYGSDEPVGVAVSSQGERIYVAETGGERLVRIFDRNGEELGSFAPPNTQPAQRAPVYLSTDSQGRVYVTDRMQHAVFIFEPDGTYLETLLSPELTLTEFVSQHTGDQLLGTDFSLNLFAGGITAPAATLLPDTTSAADLPDWSPLGVRFDGQERMLLTDVTRDQNTVHVVSLPGSLSAAGLQVLQPAALSFGASGSGDGEFLFPNSAVADSLDRVYVSDGNNGRVSVWDARGNFLYNFGDDSGEGSVSLPRGLVMDARDRLYVVDTVGQRVNVYGVGGSEAEFLFAFGDFGFGDGLFNYPGDIAMDESGRLYITDRENNRVQVWSY